MVAGKLRWRSDGRSSSDVRDRPLRFWGFRHWGQDYFLWSAPQTPRTAGRLVSSVTALALVESGVSRGRRRIVVVFSAFKLNSCQGLLLQEKDRFCVCRVGLPALEKGLLQESRDVMKQLSAALLVEGAVQVPPCGLVLAGQVCSMASRGGVQSFDSVNSC